MPVSSAIAERARKNYQAILKSLSELSQVRAAELIGVHESTVSKLVGGDMEKCCAIAAACGLKLVPTTLRCYDPDEIEALIRFARKGIGEPASLEWD